MMSGMSQGGGGGGDINSLLQVWVEKSSQLYNQTWISEHEIRCVKWISIDASSFISWPNPMFDHLIESSRWDDSNKWSNIGFGQEIDVLEMKIRTLSGALNMSEFV